jgi:uncharacterized membrane protein
MLFLHILTATLGVVGSFLWGIPFITKKVPATVAKVGAWLTIASLAGVIVSGIFLFTQNTEAFLGSDIFLANMTILALLIVVETSYFFPQTNKARSAGRLISMYSWSWIFLAAFIHPPFSYGSFMLAYSCLLCAVLWCGKLWLEKHSSQVDT